MIRSIRLCNFRSIWNSHIEFPGSGLCVVVGANGSGKSNLIKAIQFLSYIARDGLAQAAYSNRGIDGILPKAIPTGELGAATCTIHSEHELYRPPWYPRSAPRLAIEHTLDLGRARGAPAAIRQESLLFHEPLAAQFHEDAFRVNHYPSSGNRSPARPPSSRFRISRAAGEPLSVSIEPDFADYRSEYLSWLGLGLFADESDIDEPGLARLLQQFQQVPARPGESTEQVDSWISQKSQGPLALCTEANTFRAMLADTRRYDFQLARLREEQESTATIGLSSEGIGFPSTIHDLRTAPDNVDSWRRIALTMRAIAPHVFDANVSTLGTGKQFVRFVEYRTGRPVESWESSDGTLRALAILAAVETHPSDATLLIEEPEHGLHPWAIRILMDHVKEAIKTRNVQVLVTTHSQQVLDSVAPDQVIVATRSEAKGTEFTPVSKMFPAGAIAEGEVGRLWVRGLLGGVPSYE